jgi:iron(III) transport system permease protein
LFSTAVTLGCCVVGIFLAIVLSRPNLPWAGTMRLLSVLPLAIPSFLMALSVIMLFSKEGIVTRLLHFQPFNPFTPFGCFVVQVFAFFPLVTLTTSAALERMDPSLEEAASVLGAPRAYTFSTVSLPMLVPGVAAGAFLTFIRSFGDFATLELLLPSQIKVIVVEAYRDMSGNTYWGGAATMSTIMVAVILGLLAVQKYWIERNRYETMTGRAVASRRGGPAGLTGWLMFAGALLLLGFPLLNLLVILLLASSATWGATLLPSHYTLANFSRVLAPAADGHYPLLNSLWLSGMALVGALLLAGTVCFIVARTKIKGRQLLDLITVLPFIIPGTAFAIALITCFNTPPLALHLTVYIVVLAYIVTRAPYAVRSIQASFQQIGPAMEESSRTLGATPNLTTWKVLVPLIRPGIIAGAIMIFISCMTDVAITIMVCPPNWYPASVDIFNRIADSSYFAASAYGMVLMAFIFIPYIIMLKVVGSRDMSL